MPRFPTAADKISIPKIPPRRTVSSFFGGGTDTGQPSMTLDALMARQKELADRQAQMGRPTEQNSTVLGGLGTMLDRFTTGYNEGRARTEETEGRAKLAEIMGGVSPETGATQQQIAAINPYDPDLATKLWADSATRATAEKWEPMTPEERVKYGVPEGSSAQIERRSGKIDTEAGTTTKTSRLMTQEEIAASPNLDPKKPYKIDQDGTITAVGGTEASTPMTEFQSKAMGQYGVGYNANDELTGDELDKELTAGNLLIADAAGFLKPALQTGKQQVAGRAALDFASMVLRKETGAGVSANEMAQVYERYIPVPGDSPENIEAKRVARRQFLELNRGTLAGRPEFAAMEEQLKGMSEVRRKTREDRLAAEAAAANPAAPAAPANPAVPADPAADPNRVVMPDGTVVIRRPPNG